MVSLLCLVVAIGYLIGGRRRVRLVGGWRWNARHWRTAAFGAGLGLIAGLSGPLDPVARETFWLRTAQLMLILMVAGPLLVLGAPRPRIARWFRRRIGRVEPRPVWSLVAFLVFTAALIAAYLPPVYRLVAGPGLARQAGQAVMAVVGYAFWSQVIAQPGAACALSHIGRIAYLVTSSVQVRVLGLVLGFAPGSLYGVPLIDQQLAAGILIVPGVLTDLIVITVCLSLWLAQDERRVVARRTRTA